MSRLPLLLPLFLIATGCSTTGYYAQAVSGHLSLMCSARSVDKLLKDPETGDALRRKLTWAKTIRRFAITELDLPDNGSYRKYVALDRPFVVWNVVATPELSLTPETTCAPVAGCVGYRGYYRQESAERYAASLRSSGHDVYVGGVTAYSTIGWFRDPLVSTMMSRGIPDLAGVIFHELAHQRVYAKDDTAFSESFATVVETEGMRRWLALQNEARFSDYQRRQKRYDEFVGLILIYRDKLQKIYQSAITDDHKRKRKQETLHALLEEYRHLKKQWNGYEGFDLWMSGDLNNAKLASVGNYHQWVPHLNELLRESAGDLSMFYRRADEIARLQPVARQERLGQLTQSLRNLRR